MNIKVGNFLGINTQGIQISTLKISREQRIHERENLQVVKET